VSAKLEKFEEPINLYLPFKISTFFAYLSCSTIVCLISLLIILKLPQIGLTGILFLLVLYFLPSFIAYDVVAAYNDTHNVPKLLHPKRRFILLLNLLLGVTGIGWLVALALSISPGSVRVNSVKYLKQHSHDLN
jgi:hypothetical protein